MTAALTPLRGSRVRWTTLLGLLLVPLTVAGLFLWGLWNPSERLENVTAAVVNLDEPVEVDGQLVPLGRVLAAELISGGSDDDEATRPGGSGTVDDSGSRTNFTWVLTDEEDARAGLADGRFATSITIPKNFSSAATSLSEGPDGARSATIEVAESDRGRLLDTALSGIVTQTATRVLNQQLGEQFVGSVFVGMADLHDGISEAADGAGKLADGGEKLADGTGKLAEGTTGLATGAQELAQGTGQLVSGTRELADGASQVTAGAGGLASGAHDLAAGVRASADGGAELATGVEQYTGLVNSVLDPVIGGAGQALEPLQQLRAAIAALPAELFPPEHPRDQLLGQLDAAITEVTNAANGSDASQLVQLREAGAKLAGGARASANGQAELAAGADDFAAGASAFADGVATFSGGVGQLADQTPQLAAGANQLAGGAGELATGAGELADGAKQAAGGTKDLAKGLSAAAKQIPNYTEDERQVMAETAVESVRSEGGSDELFNSSGVPLFAGIALWAGALATFLVLSPLWARTRHAARGVLTLTLRSAAPAVLLGAAQGAIAGIVLPAALRYDFGQAAAFFGLAVLAGVAFGLAVQGLSARFGGFGRFLAFVLLVAAFTVGIVSTVPGLLAAVGDASPIGAAFTGFQAIASGASGAGGAALGLALWGCGGLALTAWAVARERRAA